MILNKDKLLEYFYSNLASVFWSFFLVLGGGVFIAYFARIGYMPDFDLKSSVAITAATAVTSIIVISVLLVMTILPGAFWSGIWSNLGDISKLNKYWTGSSQGKNFSGLLLWFAVPLVSIYASALSYFFWGAVTLALPSAVLFGFLFYLWVKSEFGFWESVKEWFFLVGATVVSGVLIFTPLSFIFNLSVSNDYDLKYPSWVAGSVAALFLVSANILSAVPVEGRTSLLKNFLLGFMSLFVLLWLFNKFDRIPMAVMEIYKFGNIDASKVVLKDEGCKVLEELDIELLKKENDICVMEDVLILSRLGGESYLQVHENEAEVLRFTVPSSSIVSWVKLM